MGVADKQATDVPEEDRQLDMRSRRVAIGVTSIRSRKWLVAIRLASLLPAVLATAAASAGPAPRQTPAPAPTARTARFDAFIASLRLDAAQTTEAKTLFAKARATAAQDPNPSERTAERRLLMQQAVTTLRSALRPDQRVVLDAARSREAAADLRLAVARKVRSDRFVSSLALTQQQQAIAFPIIAAAVRSANASKYNKAILLELGYRKAFTALMPTLRPEQRMRLDAARAAAKRSASPLRRQQVPAFP